MSTAKALRFDQWGVKKARQHELLQGKKLLGRGVFSAVFEGTRKNTVLKMTVDDAAYWMLNDPYIGMKHRHFPRVINDVGAIGDTRIGRFDYPIYLYEIERLERVSGEARKVANLVSGSEWTAKRSVKRALWGLAPASELLGTMVADGTLPRSIRNALKQLREFTEHITCGTLDLHMGNFMQRANGELVLSDPIANMEIWREARQQLSKRGW